MMLRKKRLEIEGNVVSVPMERIAPSPFQIRKEFDQIEIDGLAKSIAENGLLQPVSIRSVGKERYELIAGERRLRACQALGMSHISAILYDMNDRGSAVCGYIENSQRENLNPFEEAKGLKMLLSLWSCTQEEAAKRLGMTQPTLCNKLRLLALTEEQQNICLGGNLTERHARAVLAVTDMQQRTELLQKAAEQQLTVAALERMLQQKKQPKKCKWHCKIRSVEIQNFAKSIQKTIAFMQSVGVKATANRRDTEDYIEYVVRIPTRIAQQGIGS